jgi:hypothetical protein
MIDGIKIQARLLQGICRWHGFIFRAHEFKARISHAHFGQDGLQELAVGFGQPFPEKPGGHANQEPAVFRSFLTRGPKPRGEAVRVDPPLHVLQNLFPGIHSVKTLIVNGLQVQPVPEESEKSPRQLFPQLWKNCGKTQPQEPLAAAVSFWVDPVTFSPSTERPKMGLPLGTNFLFASRRPQGCQLRDWYS